MPGLDAQVLQVARHVGRFHEAIGQRDGREIVVQPLDMRAPLGWTTGRSAV
jgi:hypothetical protein